MRLLPQLLGLLLEETARSDPFLRESEASQLLRSGLSHPRRATNSMFAVITTEFGFSLKMFAEIFYDGTQSRSDPVPTALNGRMRQFVHGTFEVLESIRRLRFQRFRN